jgi:hypothetical protein
MKETQLVQGNTKKSAAKQTKIVRAFDFIPPVKKTNQPKKDRGAKSAE